MIESFRSSQLRLPWILFASHLTALIFGLIGLLIMLPNPELWANDPRALSVFNWSMQYAGSTHILLGALTMLAFGWLIIGPAKTLTFFFISAGLSLASELIGTGTGWPFGNYAYTDFLGYQVLGRVPFTIPLSWFYMGMACYLLGICLVDRFGWKRASILSVLAGVWFLTVWDLVLDPAMAHESLRVKFWIWSETGPYFGMPVKNFIGWSLTGLVFMALSRFVWREDLAIRRVPMTLPFMVYLVNVIFASVLSAGVGLWWPVLLALVLGLIPAVFALRTQWTSWRTQLQTA